MCNFTVDNLKFGAGGEEFYLKGSVDRMVFHNLGGSFCFFSNSYLKYNFLEIALILVKRLE